MARVWITDLWVKDASVRLPDGSTEKRPPSAAQLRSIKSLPAEFRTAKFGRGRRWSVGWREVVGSQKVQRAQTFAVRGRAEEFAAELEDDTRSGRYIDPRLKERTFREAAESWLLSKARIKPASRRRYRRELDNYVLPKWGDIRVGSIRHDAIVTWVAELSAGEAPFWFSANTDPNNPKRKPRPMAPAYVQHIVGRTFGGTLAYIVDQEWIARNPLKGVELPRIEVDTEEDLPSLTYSAAETLAHTAEEITGQADDRLLAQVLMYCAPRIGEATAFKIKDFDFAKRVLRVRRTWTVDEDGTRMLGSPKGWEKRSIPLPGFLAESLRELAVGRDAEEFLFQSARGHAINDRNWYNRVWIKMRKATGLATGYSVHDLRHVAVTFAIGAGADVKLVQTMVGHKDATETLNTYAALWPSRIGEVAAAIEKRRAAELQVSVEDLSNETTETEA